MKLATRFHRFRDFWADGFPYVGCDVEDPRRLIGGGPGVFEVIAAWNEEIDEFRRPASRQSESLDEEFSRLAASWKGDTMFSSSVHQIATHPAYQQIIGLGRVAVPLILRSLQREPDHWFWALRAITGIDPVPAESRGDLRMMQTAWLTWGQSAGLLE